MRDPFSPARGGAARGPHAVALTAVLAVTLSALPALPAAAEEARAAPPVGPAADHQEGRRQFAAGKYEAAIDAYRRAYELRADPSYLLDIAECYRALDVPERAVFFYRRYLSTHPNPPNRPEVEQTLAALEARLPPPPVAPSSPAPVLAPSPPALDPVAGGLAVAAGSRPLTETRPSILKRWWFWTAVGTLAAGAATLAIVAAGQEGDTIPSSTLGNKKIF